MKKFYLLFLLFSIPAFCQETAQVSLKKAKRVLFSQDGNINKEIIKSGDELLQKGGYVAVDGAYLSNKSFIDSLKKWANQGAKVFVNLGNKSKSLEKELTDSGIQVTNVPDLHAKRCVISQKSPTKYTENDSAVVFVGSHNLSNLSLFHNEIMFKIENDKELIASHMQNFNDYAKQVESTSPKKVVEKTPEKPSIISSGKHSLLGSKRKRIETMTQSKDALSDSDFIKLSSMTFDDENFVTELEQCAQKTGRGSQIEIVLDASALKHPQLLQRLEKAGISLYVFNAKGEDKIFNRYKKLQHTKMFLRKMGEKELAIISTGNLTKRSDTEKNIDEYESDPTVFASCLSIFEQLKKQSSPYSSAQNSV